MKRVFAGLMAIGALAALARWYNHESVQNADATVYLQSEHEHFHLHVDLPPGMEIEAGDTLEVLAQPPVQGETHGEVTYSSPVQLHKASWLRRNLIKRSSLLEINELVEHP